MEIAAWARLTDAEPTPDEVRLLKRIDFAYRRFVGRKDKGRVGKGKEKEIVNEVSANDAAGVHALMRTIKPKKKKAD